MKTKLFALAFLFASSVLFAADQLCINITGMSPGNILTPAGATDGFQFGVPNWVKNLPGQKDRVLELLAPEGSGTEWSDFEFKVHSAEHTRLHIALSWYAKDRSKIQYVAIRNFTNRNNRPVNWQFVGTPVAAPEAGAVLCSNTPKTGTFCEFNIGKGETVVIRGSYRLLKPEELKK